MADVTTSLRTAHEALVTTPPVSAQRNGMARRPGSRRTRRYLSLVGLMALLATMVPASPASAASGDISTVAGNGECVGEDCPQFDGDGGAATQALLDRPQGVLAVGADRFYVADTENHRVRVVNRNASGGASITVHGVGVAPGHIETVAGSGACKLPTPTRCVQYGGDGAAATSALLNWPQGLAVDSAGNLYIADTKNHVIRKVDTAGTITTVAGTGVPGSVNNTTPANLSALNGPYGLAINTVGSAPLQTEVLYIAEFFARQVRVVNLGLAPAVVHGVSVPPGAIAPVAGSGIQGCEGDQSSALQARLHSPVGVAVHGDNLYVTDLNNNNVRRVDAAGTITTVVGKPPSGTECTDNHGYSGDGGPATSARLSGPFGIAVKASGAGSGTLYVSDFGNQRIRKVDTAGIITTVAGTGTAGFSGDGGSATEAKLFGPRGVGLDSSGNLFMADTYNYRVRKIEA